MSPSSVGPGSTMARQAVDASSSKRAAQGLAGPLVAGIAVVIGTLAVGEQTSWRFTGWGADPVGHYSLAYWFAHHWTLPAADDLTWHIIADNPPAAYIAAAVVGHVVGSTFMGMYSSRLRPSSWSGALSPRSSLYSLDRGGGSPSGG